MGIEEFARQVKEASIKLAAMSADQKNRALAQIAKIGRASCRERV